MEMIWPTDILSTETWILLASIFLLLWYYFHQKWSVLKKWNISHDPPSIFKLGNTTAVFGKNAFTAYLKMKEKYGPVYGYYMGVAPAIVVHDVEIMKRIYGKDYSNFPNREVRAFKLSGKELNTSVTSARGADWKRIRSTMSPSFSSAKLRHMAALMAKCSDNLVDLLNKRIETGDSHFKVKERFSSLSLDMVLSAAFSTEVNTQVDGKEEPEITKNAKKLFKFSFFSPLIFIVLMFPGATKIFEKMNVTTVKKGPLNYFTKLVTMIMERKADNPHDQQTVDFLQLLLEHQISENDVANGVEKGMTKTEIIGNSMIMILAGFENTANTIGYLAYNLAVHPEIQASVQAEIDKMLQEGGGFDYDSINGLKMLDMCFYESLRLYTPIILNARASLEEITINGLTIPAKTSVHFPTYALAHDPEYWQDPYEFIPERMRDMSQIDPMYFQPFGAGPRNCIGLRFAVLEVKMAIAKLLYNFDLKPTDKTPQPPLELTFQGAVRPKEELILKATRRKRSTD